ncbi:MAG: class I SAM-dependent methyltransferase [Candidatus Thorarchaeota archaeon]|nr:class I SAM-dependent methyltransferase [Candidatus Thorarchaeota archaeon]
MPDIFGKTMRDALEGKDADYILERDDGFIRNTTGRDYIKPFEEWIEGEREAILNIEGPILDVGCGAGRVGDYVKSHGLEYYGVDLSPLAVEMCHKRGHENVFVMSADDIELGRSDFKTVVLFGNNFGLMGTPEGVVKMLKGFHRVTADNAIVLAGSRDPEDTDDEAHLAYHAKNRAEGKPPGQVKLRNRYLNEVDDWWYLLLCGKKLMAELAEEAGWYLEKTIEESGYNVGVLRKKGL